MSYPPCLLRDVADVLGRGIAPKYSERGDTLVINQRCIRDGRVQLSAARRHDSSLRKVAEEKLVRVGDVLVNSTGVGTLGRTAGVKELGGATAVDSHVTIVRPLETVDSRWLSYWLKYSEPSIEMMAEGSTGQTELSRHRLMELPVSCPPPDVQQEIGAILGSADDKLDSNHRISRLLEEVVMASFASLFSVEPSECGVAVSDLIAVNPSRNLKKGTVATYIGMSDLPANSAIVPNWGRRPFGSGQRFRNGDVLMARITPCLENGKTAVVDMLDEGEVGWGSTEYVVLAPAGALSTPWVYCLARSEPVRTFAIRSMSGTSGRQRFSADAFDHYRIAAPTSGALKEFNSLAVPAFEIMAQLRDESRTLSVLRDALLPGLLTGRIAANAKVVGCES